LSVLPCYVLDTNTIIDLHFGGLLDKVFQLPCTFSVTDSLADEFLDPPFHVLQDLGLIFDSLEEEAVAEITPLMERYPLPSYYDISVLILARSKHTILITGDRALRNAAADTGVDCRGTCWLIDYLANEGLITYSEAIAAYQRILKKDQHPPWEECRALLVNWKQRQKLE
jgi:hypothetical protein